MGNEWGGKERKMFLSQYHRPQMGAVPDLKGFRTSTHWGHFPGPFTLFILPTPYNSTGSLFSSWTSRLPPRSPTFFLFLFCKLTSKVSGTNPLSLSVREESFQVRNPPSEEVMWVLRNIFFPPHYSSILNTRQKHGHVVVVKSMFANWVSPSRISRILL